MRVTLGVILPSVDVQRRDRLDLPTAARHAESAGPHSVWHGDHLPADEAATIPITGRPDETAERLAAYGEAGARHVVVGFAGGDWRAQCDLFAEADRLVASTVER